MYLISVAYEWTWYSGWGTELYANWYSWLHVHRLSRPENGGSTRSIASLLGDLKDPQIGRSTSDFFHRSRGTEFFPCWEWTDDSGHAHDVIVWRGKILMSAPRDQRHEHKRLRTAAHGRSHGSSSRTRSPPRPRQSSPSSFFSVVSPT
jgi:hypothetical protein